MRPCLLLLCLAVLWGCTFSEECVRELQMDVDFPGSDVLQILSPDALHCQLACTQHHQCLFFTFLRPEWTRDNRQFYCYLKHTDSGIPLTVTTLKGVTSGYSLKPCQDSKNTCLPTIYENVDFTGSDYDFLFTATHKECQIACTKDPGCQFFSFLNEDFPVAKYRNKCHLKHSRVVPTPPKVNSLNGVVSGFSHRVCKGSSTGTGECPPTILTDTDFPGNDFEQVPAPSPEHCHFLCTAHPHCSYYSFTTRNFITPHESRKLLCYLKHNTHERPHTPYAEVMSGTSTRFCEPSGGSCMQTPYENIDFLGYDRRYVMLDDPQSCQETCTADPDCQFYTYVTESFHLPDYRRRCFLKQVITAPLPPKVVTMLGVVSGFHLRGCQSGSQDGTDCGLRHSNGAQVVRGSQAVAGAWPWQVSLQLTGSSHLCGGSIVGSQWVVTTARCLTSSSPSLYKAVLGTIHLAGDSETREVEAILKHPDFSDLTYENDVALVKLKMPIKYTDAQRPICLTDTKKEEEFWGKNCWVTGWGKDSTGETPKALQQAQVSLIKPDTCSTLLPMGGAYNTTVCARVPEGGSDTCQGDVGGPLACESDGRWYLMGITSGGVGCGQLEAAEMYTRVSSYVDWIRSSIQQ
ncbi:coagulation factor XI-like [Megalops cyprinoides]|uniref:coagulation factor XI-like n=1 Tax=Megalops cyprinoides TaxID=118141 RepID=UPI0018650BBB|nr:coagulation factor XI-like [Megalops cyprinoides]